MVGFYITRFDGKKTTALTSNEFFFPHSVAILEKALTFLLVSLKIQSFDSNA